MQMKRHQGRSLPDHYIMSVGVNNTSKLNSYGSFTSHRSKFTFMQKIYSNLLHNILNIYFNNKFLIVFTVVFTS